MTDNKKYLTIHLKAAELLGMCQEAITKARNSEDPAVLHVFLNEHDKEGNPQRPDYISGLGAVWINTRKPQDNENKLPSENKE